MMLFTLINCPFSFSTLTETSILGSDVLLPFVNSPWERVKYKSLRTSPKNYHRIQHYYSFTLLKLILIKLGKEKLSLICIIIKFNKINKRQNNNRSTSDIDLKKKK